jgi:vacuolar-type H+-ATPase subunit I/STV1
MIRAKLLYTVGSSLSALLAMGGGVGLYQKSQRERDEAQRATVVALHAFHQTIERARGSIQQSTDLRDELIGKTGALLRDSSSTEQELLAHAAQVQALEKRREVLHARLASLRSETAAALTSATDSVGKCRKILLADKLPEPATTKLEGDIRAMTDEVQDVRARLARLEALGKECDHLADNLLLFSEGHGTALARIREIRRESQQKLEQQKQRQTAATEAEEKLRKLQEQLKEDLSDLTPKP